MNKLINTGIEIVKYFSYAGVNDPNFSMSIMTLSQIVWNILLMYYKYKYTGNIVWLHLWDYIALCL